MWKILKISGSILRTKMFLVKHFLRSHFRNNHCTPKNPRRRSDFITRELQSTLYLAHIVMCLLNPWFQYLHNSSSPQSFSERQTISIGAAATRFTYLFPLICNSAEEGMWWDDELSSRKEIRNPMFYIYEIYPVLSSAFDFIYCYPLCCIYPIKKSETFFPLEICECDCVSVQVDKVQLAWSQNIQLEILTVIIGGWIKEEKGKLEEKREQKPERGENYPGISVLGWRKKASSMKSSVME